MRVGDEVMRGNVKRDRRKLFPEHFGKRPGAGQGKKAREKKAAGRPAAARAKAAKPATRAKRAKQK
jgi:hypothetical protein